MKTKPIINRPTLTLVILSFILIAIPQLNRPPLTEARTADLITHPPTTPQLRQIIGQQSLMFVEEHPQRYQLRGTDQSMWFTPQAIWVQTSEVGIRRQTLGVSASRQSSPPTTIQNTKLTFLNANPNVTIEPLARHETKVSYFMGNNPDEWRTDVAVYQGLRYRNVYPNTDLVVSSQNGQITWQWEQTGNKQPRPRTTNSVAPPSVMVMVDDGNTVRTVSWDNLWPQYNTNRSTTRQDSPDDLLWSTFLGGSYEDNGKAVTVDDEGKVYVTGYTRSSEFPTTAGAYDTTHLSYNPDIFVVKLNRSGTAIIYATFVGGNNDDKAYNINVDNDSNIYISGNTSSGDFPTTSKAYDTTYNSSKDGFVIKLNNTGTNLIYSTYLGGTNFDSLTGMAIDNSGNAYLIGHTQSSNFPTTTEAYDTTYNEGIDVFAVKLNSNGTALNYATFLGGNRIDYGEDITVDSNGNAYLTGYTGSDDFPVTLGAYDTTYNDTDAFVVKLNNKGSNLSYATLLGGSRLDYGYAIAIDSDGYAYLTGKTTSIDFRTTPNAYKSNLTETSYSDIFIAKLNRDGSDLVYATYLGSSGVDEGLAIAIDDEGNAYLTGQAGTTDFPTTVGTYDATFNGGSTYRGDAFLVRLNSSGTALNYATFLGGSEDDKATSLAIDNDGNIFVTGVTESRDFPTTTTAYDTSFNGGTFDDDAFVLKFSIVPQSGAVINKTTLNFDAQTANTTSATQTVRLTNNGGADLILKNLDISEGFAQTNDCGQLLLAGASCTFNIAFTPTHEKTFVGSLTIESDAVSSPNVVSLSGRGVPPPPTPNPDDIVWSTFLGDGRSSGITAMTVDNEGNIYLTGVTYSDDFPATAGAYDTTYGGDGELGGDAFVIKLNSDGTDVIYATLLGGSEGDLGYDIAVDNDGNAYVTGRTESSNFPSTDGAYDTTLDGFVDAFIVKLNSSGNALSYATFLGGSQGEEGKGIVVNNEGNVYIIGETDSGNFPTTDEAYDTTHNGSKDIFAAKLNSSGTSLDYATILGGSRRDHARAITLDEEGNTYLTGYTISDDFPVTDNAYDTTFDSSTGLSEDIFIVKLNSRGNDLIYATYLGGGKDDQGYAIAVDNNGHAYVTGSTESTDFPTSTTAYDTTFNGGNGWLSSNDAFIIKLSNTGDTLDYASFLGGSGNETGNGIAVDDKGIAYLTGETSSKNFPTTGKAYDDSYDISDVFLVKMNSVGTGFSYATFLGGHPTAESRAIVLDSAGYAYLAGNTKSSSFPTTDGVYDTTFSGEEGFVTKLFIKSEPELALNKTILNFGSQMISNTSTAQEVILTNAGGDDLNLDKINIDREFDQVNDCSNILLVGDNCTINITFTPTTTGSLTGTLTIESDALSSPDTVSLNGLGVAPMIALSPAHVTASMIEGSTPPPAQNLTINNGGTGAFTWTISYQNEAAWWLAISPERGLASDEATIYFANTNSLPAGSYTATITISSDEALNSPQFVTVTLTVTEKPILVIQPTNLNFETIVGRNPISQVINISNAANSVLSWTVTATPTNFNLSLNQNNGTTPATVTVSIDAANLTTGIYNDVLVIKGDKAQDSPQAINLKLLIKEPAKPDLASNITTNNPVCLAHPTTVTTTVMNQGQAEAGTHNLSLYSNNTLIATSSVKVLTVGNRITFSHTLTPTVTGSYTLKAVVDANNFITESNETNNESFIILLVQADKTAPTGTIELNNGNNRTDTTQVNLHLTTTKDNGACAGETITLRLSNDGLTWTAWQTYTTTLSWTLPETSGNHIVSAQFRDEAGNISPTYTDTITLLVPESTLIVTPQSLTLTLKEGVVTSTTIMIGSSTGALTWTATLTNSDRAKKRSTSDWLTVSPISGTTPSTTTIAVDSTSLASGSYSHIVTIHSTSGNRLVPISVRVITRTTYLPVVIK